MKLLWFLWDVLCAHTILELDDNLLADERFEERVEELRTRRAAAPSKRARQRKRAEARTRAYFLQGISWSSPLPRGEQATTFWLGCYMHLLSLYRTIVGRVARFVSAIPC